MTINIRTLIFLLALGASCQVVASADDDLTTAIEGGDLDGVEQALANGANKNKLVGPNKFGYTPLILATKYNLIEIVQALIKAKATLDAEDDGGFTALMLAAHYGYTETARALIQAGADVKKTDNYGGNALMSAAYSGNAAIIQAIAQALAKEKIDAKNRYLNAKDKYGQTALMQAVHYEKVAAAQALIQAGANIDEKDPYGDTALLMATRRGQEAMVRVFTEEAGTN